MLYIAKKGKLERFSILNLEEHLGQKSHVFVLKRLIVLQLFNPLIFPLSAYFIDAALQNAWNV